MRYTVVCHPIAESELAKLFVDHWGTPLAVQISSAANRLDSELAVRPLDLGAESTTKLRSLVIFPLSVKFTVSEDDRTVTILEYLLVVNS